MRKLLFLSHRIPYPPDKGDKIRAWHILQHLMRTNSVFVGCLVDDEADWAHVPALRARCAELGCFPLNPRWQKLRALSRLRPGKPLTLDYFHSPRLRRWVLDTIEREEIDRIFIFCSAMAPYVIDAAGARRVLDFIDAELVQVDRVRGAVALADEGGLGAGRPNPSGLRASGRPTVRPFVLRLGRRVAAFPDASPGERRSDKLRLERRRFPVFLALACV